MILFTIGEHEVHSGEVLQFEIPCPDLQHLNKYDANHIAGIKLACSLINVPVPSRTNHWLVKAASVSSPTDVFRVRTAVLPRFYVNIWRNTNRTHPWWSATVTTRLTANVSC